jgi:NAD(P)H-dependent FMN reductase
MITIVVGTNRKGNESQKFAQLFLEMIEKANEAAQILKMEDIPPSVINHVMYASTGQDETVAALQDKFITPANKFIFVVPEYNGSITGILKLFIDAISVRNYKENFNQKTSALIGIASGRAGNLRGMDHLSSILMHMNGYVLPNILPISNIKSLYDEKGNINHAPTIESMNQLVKDLIAV